MVRAVLLAVAVVIILLAGWFGLVWLHILPNPLVRSATTEDTAAFRFRVSSNAFGDRILLQAPVGITYTPQPNAPDQITITPRGGRLSGSFIWTVIPSQGGERRILGEYETGGRVYKVCEFLDKQDNRAISGAERYFPINNSGQHFHIPERIDPSLFDELFDTALPEQARVRAANLAPDAGLSISAGLAHTASDLIGVCTGLSGAARR